MSVVAGVTAPDRVLMRAGALLFLIGLITGLVAPLMQIPRMGLSSHLEGVMNGMLLMILGLIWPRLKLKAWGGTTAFWSAVYGSFANWLTTLLSALWGAAAAMPIAGQGATGTPLAEAIIAGLLLSVAGTMILTFVLLLWGLRK